MLKRNQLSIILTISVMFMVTMCISNASAASKDPKRPNIVFFLIDDLSWTDLNCRNSDGTPTPGGEFDSTYYKTPNIAKLREMGVRFTNAHAYTYCTPTRAALMTGKYPSRLKMTGLPFFSICGKGTEIRTDASARIGETEMRYIGGYQRSELPLEETTVAEALKARGYTTCHVGKWHLCAGDTAPSPDVYYPDKQGFDYNIGGFHSNIIRLWKESRSWNIMPNFENPKNSKTGYRDWIVKDAKVYDDFFAKSGKTKYEYENTYGPLNKDYKTDLSYITDIITHRCLEFIDLQTREEAKDKPFFLYAAHYAVHHDIDSKQDLQTEFDAKAGGVSDPRGIQDSKEYASMLRSTDFSVGRVIKYLETKGILDNTVIICMSDNGGCEKETNAETKDLTGKLVMGKTIPTECYPLNKFKGANNHGGTRVPLIIYWPSVTDRAETRNKLICQMPVHAVDIMPTILDAAGSEIPADIDGVSIKPLIMGGSFHRENNLEEDNSKQNDDNAIFCNVPNTFKVNGRENGQVTTESIYPASYVQKDGYMLYKRYDDKKYSWPSDFDFRKGKLQLKLNPDAVTSNSICNYELYKTEIKEGVDFSLENDVLELNGSSSILVAGAKGINGSSARTIYARIKTDAGKDQAIVSWGDPEAEGGFWGLYINSAGQLVQYVLGGSVLSEESINDGLWHSVATVFPNEGNIEDVRIYIDGSAVNTSYYYTKDLAVDTGDIEDIRIGRFSGMGDPYYFDGDISDLRIYGYALSSNDFANNIAEEKQPVLQWSFDDGNWSGNGKDSYLESKSYKGITSNKTRTISAWIKTQAKSDQAIAGWGKPKKGKFWGLYLNSNGQLVQSIWDGEVISSESINDGMWHNVVSVFEGKYITDIKLFIDGKAAEVSIQGNEKLKVKTSKSRKFAIGAFAGIDHGYYFSGEIDEVKIFDYADYPCNEWKLDDKGGYFVRDYGLAQHGTITGDISEENNLYNVYIDGSPEQKTIVNNLKAILNDWQKEVDAQTIRPVAVVKDCFGNTAAYDSINEAVKNADDGDTVVICPGMHRFGDTGKGSHIIIDKSITLESIDPYDPETVKATRLNIPQKFTIEVVADNVNLNINGITVCSISNRNKLGIYGKSATGVIENCILQNSYGENISDYNGSLRNCIISDKKPLTQNSNKKSPSPTR